MVSENQILKYAVEHGIVDLSTICQQVEMLAKQEVLKKHDCTIWQDHNGYYITYVKDKNYKKGRRLIKRKVKQDLEQAIIDFYTRESPKIYFEDCMLEWAKQKLEYGEIMKQTYDRYVYDYKRYAVGTILETVPIEEIDTDMLEDCVKKIIHDNEMTSKRWNNFKGVIIGSFKYAKRKGYTDISIHSFFGEADISRRMFKQTRIIAEKQIFQDDEVVMIEKYIREKPFSITNMAILFAFQTGLRVGELSTLKPTDISERTLSVMRTEERFKDEKGHYVREVRESTKGRDGYRYVVLTDKALDIVREIDPKGEYLFEQNGNRIKGNDISNKLSRICKHLGIPPRSIHKVRKTYATNLLCAGVDEKLIENQMGHTDIATTKRYYFFNKHKTEEIQEIISKAIAW